MKASSSGGFLKNAAYIVLIGIVTTISRIIGQFLIPPGDQSVLEPSIFEQSGRIEHLGGTAPTSEGC